jgi:RHS repeat-associated protein
MLTLPTAPGTATGQYTLKWDAWNRLVEVKDGTTTLASYKYDGAFRRLTLTSAGQTRQFYYNRQWRAVEERIAGASIAVDRQYTWGLRDRWDLLRRKRSTGGNTLNEVHFCLRDYLDPVAIVGTDGLVKERFAYDAFGKTRFLASDYAADSASGYGWDWLFHGEFWDAGTRLYNYGYRYFDAEMGRWLTRDPIGERGGLNLYAMVRNRTIINIDILGKNEFIDNWFMNSLLPNTNVVRKKPNEESFYNVHGSFHEIVITVNPCCCQQIADEVWNQVKTFSQMDGNPVADMNIDGNIGTFTPHGLGALAGLTLVTDFYWDVELTIDEESRTVTARTLEGHPLVGVRTWWVKTNSTSESCSIRVGTMGYEKPSNLFNFMGSFDFDISPNADFPLRGGYADQRLIWDQYLKEIGRELTVENKSCSVDYTVSPIYQWNTGQTINPWIK